MSRPVDAPPPATGSTGHRDAPTRGRRPSRPDVTAATTARRPLRGRRAHRPRWHGRGAPRPRHPPRPHRRHQDAALGPRPRPLVPGPVPPRGPVRRLARTTRPSSRSTTPARTRPSSPAARRSRPYIVMEYVEGQTLREVLHERTHDAPRARPLEITEGILAALDYSHRDGIVHRDIKPANVMLTDRGDVKVMDFGIARAIADTAATMTQTQAVDRHRAVPLPGAGAGRDGRRPLRPLLHRLPALRAAHRPAAVRRRLPGLGRLPARRRGAAAPVAAPAGDLPRPGRRRAARAGQGPGRPLPGRRAVPRGPGGRPHGTPDQHRRPRHRRRRRQHPAALPLRRRHHGPRHRRGDPGHRRRPRRRSTRTPWATAATPPTSRRWATTPSRTRASGTAPATSC